MARVNTSTGEVVQNIWTTLLSDIDESVIYLDGKAAAERGDSRCENPWNTGTYAHAVWYDGWISAGRRLIK